MGIVNLKDDMMKNQIGVSIIDKSLEKIGKRPLPYRTI